MKQKTFLCLVISTICLVGSTVEAVAQNSFVRNDTLILYENTYRVGNDVETQKAYVETNPDSEIVKTIIDSSFLQSDQSEYENTLSKLKNQYPDYFRKHTLGNFPTHWIPLSSYRGRYYIYELEAYYPCYFTDSVFVRVYMDGSYPSILKRFEKKSETHYQAQIIDLFSSCSDKSETLDFYLIDADAGITVMRQQCGCEEKKDVQYKLMVPAEKARNFDIIAWKTRFEMPDDRNLVFDKLDFNKLIGE